MFKIENSVVINRPIEEVFAFTTDLEKMTEWVGELQESKNISAGPVGVGTTFTNVVGIVGRRLEQTYKRRYEEVKSRQPIIATPGQKLIHPRSPPDQKESCLNNYT